MRRCMYLFSTISSVRWSSSLLLFSRLLIISRMVTARLRSLRSFNIFSYEASSFLRFCRGKEHVNFFSWYSISSVNSALSVPHLPFGSASSLFCAWRPRKGHWCWSRHASPVWRQGWGSRSDTISSSCSSTQTPPLSAHHPLLIRVWPPAETPAERRNVSN